MPQRTIPVISSLPELANWQAALRNTIVRVNAPPVPANLMITSKQGGNYLTWSMTENADGYRVDISENGDFASILTSVLLPGVAAVSYFDTVPTSGGGSPKKRYYRVRATAGTTQNPQNVVGAPSATVSSSAIAPNDTVTAPVTTVDTSNYDKINAGSAGGDYRGFAGPSPE